MIKINATKVLLRELPKTDKVTAGGIIVPGMIVKEPSSIGIAVKVGTGIPSLPMTVECGDKVLYSPHAVQRVAIPNDERTGDIELKGEYFQLDVKDVLLCWSQE